MLRAGGWDGTAGKRSRGCQRAHAHREAKTSLQGFKIHRNKLRSMGHEDKDIVRLHHDCDKSFEGGENFDRHEAVEVGPRDGLVTSVAWGWTGIG